MKISIIGAGSWASAIASLLSDKNEVLLYARDRDLERSINEDHVNFKYFPKKKLSENIRATSDLKTCFENRILINAIPTQNVRRVYENTKEWLRDDQVIINLSKGLELNTHYRISEILKDIYGDLNFAVLSGPSHAEEVIDNMPTVVVCASEDLKLAKEIQNIFSRSYFRVYTSTDVNGVELGGSVKNILAFSIGMASGLGYGDNSKAALITRGIHEMERFASYLGAEHNTIHGLAGIGDLIVTATSEHSRNNRAGKLIGQGKSLDDLSKEINMVIEGIPTTKAVYELSRDMGIEMPITNELYKVLFEGKDVDQSVRDLMGRDLKNEY